MRLKQVSLGIVSFLLFISCGKDSSPTAPIVPVGTELVFIAGDSTYFWESVRAGMEIGAAELLLNATWVYAKPRDAATQINLLNQYREAKVAGIALLPLDPAGQSSLISEIDTSGIPVVTLDTDVPGSKRFCHLGTDPILAGKTMADSLAVLLSGAGKVVVFVGNRNVWGTTERLNAFTSEAQAQGLSVETVKEDGGDISLAKQNVRDALNTYSDLAALVGINLHEAPAIAEVLAESGEPRTAKVVGYDYEKLTLDYLKAGRIDLCITPRPYSIGYLAANILYDVLRVGETEALKLIPEDKHIYPGIYIVNSATAAEFESYLSSLGILPL